MEQAQQLIHSQLLREEGREEGEGGKKEGDERARRKRKGGHKGGEKRKNGKTCKVVKV